MEGCPPPPFFFFLFFFLKGEGEGGSLVSTASLTRVSWSVCGVTMVVASKSVDRVA